MSSLNKVILIGNLGKDPETKTFDHGQLTNITLATSETWTDKQTGEKIQNTEWHNVVFKGKLSEIADKYLKKGAQIYVEGQLKTRTWDKQDGTKGYATEIVVDGFNGKLIMLGKQG